MEGKTVLDFIAEGDIPFSPGFGMRPLVLAGRDSLTGQIGRAFRTGPRDPWFTTVLVGDRGVGKTAVLDAVEKSARESGWAVIHEQAVEKEGLLALLLKDLVKEAGSLWTRTKKTLANFDIEASLGTNVGVASAGIKIKSKPAARVPTEITRDILRVVGVHAKQQGRGVLLTIDEVQSWTAEGELNALAAALQIVTKREQLPVAVIFAGLPVSLEIMSGAGTFFERVTNSTVEDLPRESTEYAFLKTAEKRGVLIEPEALEVLVEGTSGYPYLIQLAGYHAWPPVGSPRVITADLARDGVSRARQEMDKLYSGRWEKCSPMEQAYLWAVAEVGESATAKDIAATLKRSTEQLGPTRHALIHEHHVLDAAGYGKVVFSLPGFSAWIRSRDPVEIPEYHPRRC
ncbi:MAG: hypothetical protein B7Z69_06925 [Actinobacteria bacterium 21-73-9]|nr:MAG: hypothetical protein B7Z69_06925 [Actinobacteria bacterium 21-73-9]